MSLSKVTLLLGNLKDLSEAMPSFNEQELDEVLERYFPKGENPLKETLKKDFGGETFHNLLYQASLSPKVSFIWAARLAHYFLNFEYNAKSKLAWEDDEFTYRPHYQLQILKALTGLLVNNKLKKDYKSYAMSYILKESISRQEEIYEEVLKKIAPSCPELIEKWPKFMGALKELNHSTRSPKLIAMENQVITTIKVLYSEEFPALIHGEIIYNYQKIIASIPMDNFKQYLVASKKNQCTNYPLENTRENNVFKELRNILIAEIDKRGLEQYKYLVQI